MKATHKLRNNYEDEWLLFVDGSRYWYSIKLRDGKFSEWEGPTYEDAVVIFADKERYTLTKLNTFKGNK